MNSETKNKKRIEKYLYSKNSETFLQNKTEKKKTQIQRTLFPGNSLR